MERKMSEKRHLASSNLSFQGIPIGKNGFHRMNEEKHIFQRVRQNV